MTQKKDVRMQISAFRDSGHKVMIQHREHAVAAHLKIGSVCANHPNSYNSMNTYTKSPDKFR